MYRGIQNVPLRHMDQFELKVSKAPKTQEEPLCFHLKEFNLGGLSQEGARVPSPQITRVSYQQGVVGRQKNLARLSLIKVRSESHCLGWTRNHLFSKQQLCLSSCGFPYFCLKPQAPTSFSLSKVNLLSRVPLFVTPQTVAYQASLSMGFSRWEYWSGLPFPCPGDLPDPGIEPGSPALQADALPSEPPGKSSFFSLVQNNRLCTSPWGFLVAQR